MKRYQQKTIAFVVSAMIAAGIVLLSPLRASADKKDMVNGVLKMWQESVITVKMVITTRVVVGGKEANRGESKFQATAAVIDSSGLAVLPLSLTDPSRLANLFRNSSYAGEDMPEYNVSSQVTDLKLIFASGKEVAGQVVLRDKDLDLAFFRPTDKLPKPAAAIDLKKGADVDTMDEVVFINRLGRVADRKPGVFTDFIQAKVTKPRPFYVPGYIGMEAGLGAPVFTLDGKFVGLVVLRTTGGQIPFSPGPYYGLTALEIIPVIMPAADILESAEQVPKRKK